MIKIESAQCLGILLAELHSLGRDKRWEIFQQQCWFMPLQISTHEPAGLCYLVVSNNFRSFCSKEAESQAAIPPSVHKLLH